MNTMKFVMASFTRNGAKLSDEIQKHLRSLRHFCEAYAMDTYAPQFGLLPFKSNIGEWTRLNFDRADCIIFIGASGIAVRAIAPFLQSKINDPAVLVIDDNGKFVIPLLSGHIGGANRFTQIIADFLNAAAVITTASDIHHKFAADTWAAEHQMIIANPDRIKNITSAILDGETIGLSSDFELKGKMPDQIRFTGSGKTGICISLDENKKPFDCTLNLLPKIISVGIGCRKGTNMETIEKNILDILSKYHISINAVKNIASVDLKKNEKGLIEFAKKYDIAFSTYSADMLSQAEGIFESSEFVLRVTGVDNICERAAVTACENGKIIINKTVSRDMTFAAAQANWRISF